MPSESDIEVLRKAFLRRTAYLRGKDIHVVGIAGAEGAAVLELLVEQEGW